jgi:hypothetical protein
MNQLATILITLLQLVQAHPELPQTTKLQVAVIELSNLQIFSGDQKDQVMQFVTEVLVQPAAPIVERTAEDATTTPKEPSPTIQIFITPTPSPTPGAPASGFARAPLTCALSAASASYDPRTMLVTWQVSGQVGGFKSGVIMPESSATTSEQILPYEAAALGGTDVAPPLAPSARAAKPAGTTMFVLGGYEWYAADGYPARVKFDATFSDYAGGIATCSS